jgi:hypothetical protein
MSLQALARPQVTQGAAAAPPSIAQHPPKASGGSFATVLERSQNDLGVSTAQIKDFFASRPDEQAIAKQAASMGLDKSQIAQAMQIGGYSKLNFDELQSEIDRFVNERSGGYLWKSDGTLAAYDTNEESGATPSAKGSDFFTKDRSLNFLDANHYGATYAKICSSDVVSCNHIVGEKRYSTQEVKDYFKGNPSTNEIASFAAARSLSAENLAQMLAIGTGVAYDPQGVTASIKNLDGYALGPDNIVVKLKPGETKRHDGMLEGSWSAENSAVSYTEWARQWYAASNGGVQT